MGHTIGIDVGGTKVAAGVVDEEGHVLAQLRRESPRGDPAATEATITALVGELRESYEIEAVGVGAAGFIDEKRSTVLFAPNLNWHHHQPLRADLETAVRLPVVVENDANVAAWGEYRFGAGLGEDFLVCVTVGTGIGGGIVLDGELYRGRFGIGAEIGHLTMVPGGRLCGCGLRGCWEQYASGNALVRDARERAAEARQDAALLLSLGDGTPEGIAGRDVTEAARQGDPVALAAFAALADWIGLGLADLAAVLDPGCFVLAGGVSEAGDLLVESVQAAFARSLTGGANRPLARVKVATLGGGAGLVGAADLARRR
jgi:glucokinase